MEPSAPGQATMDPSPRWAVTARAEEAPEMVCEVIRAASAKDEHEGPAPDPLLLLAVPLLVLPLLLLLELPPVPVVPPDPPDPPAPPPSPQARRRRAESAGASVGRVRMRRWYPIAGPQDHRGQESMTPTRQDHPGATASGLV